MRIKDCGTRSLDSAKYEVDRIRSALVYHAPPWLWISPGPQRPFAPAIPLNRTLKQLGYGIPMVDRIRSALVYHAPRRLWISPGPQRSFAPAIPLNRALKQPGYGVPMVARNTVARWFTTRRRGFGNRRARADLLRRPFR